VNFKNKLLLIGGDVNKSTQVDEGLNDIWSSSDGFIWTKEKDNAEFPELSSHQVVEHDSRLYIVGGEHGLTDNRLDQVWSSGNGIDWRLGYKTPIKLRK
jgi:hypothetical protein